MLERVVCVLRLVSCDELKERKAARTTIETLREANGFQLTVCADVKMSVILSTLDEPKKVHT